MSYIPSGVDLELRTTKYDASSRSVIASAGKVDASLDGIIDSANAAERAINNIDGSVSLTANVDDSDLRVAKGLHDDLNTNTSTTTGVSDADLRSAKGLHDDVNTNTNTVANVDASALDNAVDLVDTLSKPIVIAVSVGGAAAGLLGAAAGAVGVAGIVEMDTALSSLEGRAGRLIPQAEELIIDLYTNAWGDSRQAIADVITEADNLNIAAGNLEEAVRAAFNVSDTGIGETEEVLRAMDTMVKNELAGSFTEAADLLVTGLQNGADRGKDLLDTFNEYGSTFKELKISGPAAIGLITSGLEAGVDNSDRIADAMREIGIRLGEIGTNEDITNAFTQLDELSNVDLAASLDAYNAGEMSGDDFFEGFFAALSDAVATDPVQAQLIAASLVGTISEDFGIETIAQLTPQWDTAMGELEGRAETASNTINTNLSTALVGLQRTLEQEFSDILTEVVDADALVDRTKEAITRFSAELQSGASISEAVAIGLEISPESIQRFESVIGNITIVFAQAIASVLDVVNQGEAANALRESIAGAVEQQFTFDLKLADDGEGVVRSINTAMARGMDNEEIGRGIQQAISEALAAGNVQAAQALAQGLTTALIPPERAIQPGQPGWKEDFIKNQQGSEIGALIAETVDFSLLEKQIQDTMVRVQGEFDTALNSGDFDLARRLAEQLGQTELVALVDELSGAWVEAEPAIATATTSAAEDVESMSSRMSASADETETSVIDMDVAVGVALDSNKAAWEDWQLNVTEDIDSVNKMIDSVMEKAAGIGVDLSGEREDSGDSQAGRAGGGSFGPGWRGMVGEEGPEIMTANTSGSVINAASSRQLMTALSSLFGGAGGGNTTNNYINVNQSNNAQTRAQADMIGFRTAKSVRGYT